MIKNKVALISWIYAIGLTLRFWFGEGTRYHQLISKNMMGSKIASFGALTFHDYFFASRYKESWEYLFRLTLNWLKTNQTGMIFGISLAACIPFLFSNSRSKSKIKETFKGLIIGAPLGICANCSAPLALEVYRSSKSLSRTLTILQSSPTLNPIVLMILFNLFPPTFGFCYLAIIATHLFILNPFLVKYFDNIKTSDENLDFCEMSPFVESTWSESVWFFVKNYLLNLFKVGIKVIPWMVLAGFVGSLIETSSLQDMFFQYKVNLLSLLLCGIFGTIMPVPMTMNIVFPFALSKAGLPLEYCLVLSVTLGIFSVYPFLLIFKYLSRSFALIMLLATFIVSPLLSYSFSPFFKHAQDFEMAGALDILNSVHSKIDVQNIIDTTCSYWKQNDRIQECREALATRSLVNFYRIDFCHNLKDQHHKIICLSSIVTRIAKIESRPEHCQLLKDWPESFNYCLSLVLSEEALQGLNLSLCHKIPLKNDMINCSNQVSMAIIVNKRDENQCLTLKENFLVTSCKKQISSLKASELLKPEECQVGDIGCLQAVLLNYYTREKRFFPCNKMPSVQQYQCNEIVLSKMPLFENKIQYCIDNPSESCLKVVLSLISSKENLIKFCHSSYQCGDMQYHDAAVTIKDSSICSMITNQANKTACWVQTEKTTQSFTKDISLNAPSDQCDEKVGSLRYECDMRLIQLIEGKFNETLTKEVESSSLNLYKTFTDSLTCIFHEKTSF